MCFNFINNLRFILMDQQSKLMKRDNHDTDDQIHYDNL